MATANKHPTIRMIFEMRTMFDTNYSLNLIETCVTTLYKIGIYGGSIPDSLLFVHDLHERLLLRTDHQVHAT